jgi:hypothetical protein
MQEPYSADVLAARDSQVIRLTSRLPGRNRAAGEKTIRFAW